MTIKEWFFNMFKRDRFARRFIMMVIGVVLCSGAVGFFKASVFGVDPFQCFAQGIGLHVTFLNYGTFYTLLNLLFLILDFFIARRLIGIATFVNMFLTGYIVSASEMAIKYFCPEPTLIQRIVFLVIGVVVMCFASALYFTADLGVSTYDAIALTIADRKPHIGKFNIHFKWIRVACDLVCVAVGYFTGAVVGVGTVITAFFMGPLISFFKKYVSEPILAKGTVKKG